MHITSITGSCGIIPGQTFFYKLDITPHSFIKCGNAGNVINGLPQRSLPFRPILRPATARAIDPMVVMAVYLHPFSLLFLTIKPSGSLPASAPIFPVRCALHVFYRFPSSWPAEYSKGVFPLRQTSRNRHGRQCVGRRIHINFNAFQPPSLYCYSSSRKRISAPISLR